MQSSFMPRAFLSILGLSFLLLSGCASLRPTDPYLRSRDEPLLPTAAPKGREPPLPALEALPSKRSISLEEASTGRLIRTGAELVYQVSSAFYGILAQRKELEILVALFLMPCMYSFMAALRGEEVGREARAASEQTIVASP